MSTLTREIAEALYIVNKTAKQHSTRAKNYQSAQQHTRANKHNEIKDELYQVKTAAVEHLSDKSTHIEKHTIGPHKYYCFYFEDGSGEVWSFHLPTGETSNTYPVDETKELSEFTPTQEAVKSSLEITDALSLIEEYCNTYYSGPTMQL